MNWLPTFTGNCKLHDNSLLALYTECIGRQRNDTQLKDQATQLYIESLQMLRQMQSRSIGYWFNKAESLLGAILIFSKYELLSSADGDGNSIHIQGGLRILQELMQHLPQTQLSKIV